MATLTDLIRHLDPETRADRRRRIHAMADWWALYLVKKYGDAGHALARCRQHQMATTRHDAGLRNQIWSQVNRRLKFDLNSQ